MLESHSCILMLSSGFSATWDGSNTLSLESIYNHESSPGAIFNLVKFIPRLLGPLWNKNHVGQEASVGWRKGINACFSPSLMSAALLIEEKKGSSFVLPLLQPSGLHYYCSRRVWKPLGQKWLPERGKDLQLLHGPCVH